MRNSKLYLESYEGQHESKIQQPSVCVLRGVMLFRG